MTQWLQRWLALPAGEDGLPAGSAELERAIQRRMYRFGVAFIGVLLAIYVTMTVARGNPPQVWLVLGIIGTALAANIWAVRRHGDHGRALLWLHGTMFLGVFVGALLRVGIDTSAFWWMTVLPFVAILSGHLLAGVVMTAVVVGYVVLSYVAPYQLIADDGLRAFRLHLAVALSSVYACAYLALGTLWRRQLQQALERARAAALAAAAAKARFLATMSHEIRTPLAGIIGAAELLRSGPAGDVQRAQLAALQAQSAKALLALINDVLDWSKLEAGKVALEAEPVYLRGLVFEANELFAVAAFDKGIELTSSCNPDVPRRFVGDATRIRQIINNLVGNAVKFTHRGGVHVHLALEGDDPAAPLPQGVRRLRIEVADSGIGIAPEPMARLFGAFEQADASVTRRYGGTGLGLSISQELARLMGGRIEVTSTPGQGSTFSLVLALPVAEAPEDAVAPRSEPGLLLACAGSGLLRHLRSLLHELQIEPDVQRRLPDDVTLAGRRLLIVDAPLLGELADVRAWLSRQAMRGLRVVVMAPLNADAVVGMLPGALLLYKPVRRGALRAVLAAAGEAASAPAPPAARPADTATVRPGLRVLLCEDNPVNQIIVQTMLGELGAATTLAGNGSEALDRLARQPFDIVLMDLQMPELDGLAATRRWRAAEAARGNGARVPIVAMTANSEVQDGAAARAAGMDGFLAKPFGIAALRKCLTEHAGAAVAR